MTNKNLKPDEAQIALDSIEMMERAGYRRALPPRWYGVGLSLIVAIGFSLYAMEDPGNTPALIIVLGVAIFVGATRESSGVIGRELPETKTGLWGFAGVCMFLFALFFGGIIVKRAYDVTWVPVVTGIIAGITIFLLSESERRYYLKKAANGLR